MMGKSILCHALPLIVLLTCSQIRTIAAAPVANDIANQEWEYYYDCDSGTSSSTAGVTRTVLESSDGEVYVPFTTSTRSIPCTTKGTTAYWTTVVTSYSESSFGTAKSASTVSVNRPSSTTSLSVTSNLPVLSTRVPNTSVYTLSNTGSLTSLSSSAVQSASTTVKIQTSGVRLLWQ